VLGAVEAIIVVTPMMGYRREMERRVCVVPAGQCHLVGSGVPDGWLPEAYDDVAHVWRRL
jgi:hypothetical protein